MRVRDIMTPAIYSVDAETAIPEVAETLINSHIHRLLVTSGERVVGIITSSDLLGLLVREPE
jgi:CBS domain-containing protein